jgi:hypothetical protein
MALISLYFFRSAAIAVYVLCGLFTDNYVLSVSSFVTPSPASFEAEHAASSFALAKRA